MITQIHYKNFKALRDATLPLGRFTLIVGANGTGKSTAMQALKYVQNPSINNIEKIISVENDEFDAAQISVTWDYNAGISEYTAYWSQPPYSDSVSFSQNYLVENLNYSSYKQIPSDAVHKNKIYELEDSLQSFSIFSFDAERIVNSVPIKRDMSLGVEGSNLAGILDQLRDSAPERFEEINLVLNNWFPEYDRILFETPDDGRKAFLLRTKFGKHKIKASDLSHGTRLALAYLTVAYLPNPPKIVSFEEPERGVHPRLLEKIQEAMDRLAYPETFGEKREPVQVIATTHSPYLLDLYKDRREEIVIADKGENGVRFNRLVDLPHIEEILKDQDAPLGDIWFSGILGGVPA